MIKKIKHMRNEEGFSLLELVVAVGILLVLTVGGLLAYNGITKNARVAAVQSAADEVYTGAVAYDSNGQHYKDAEAEWMETRNGDSITVEVGEKNLDGSFCVVAEMVGHPGITASKGSGCDNTGDGSGNPGDGEPGSGEETTPPVIETPATAAECFEFDDGVIYFYYVDECGTDVVIPETINGVAVVEIFDNAFMGNQLTSVELNEGLETIGDSAFMGNDELTSVVIPDSVETIGDSAFEHNQLTSVVIGNSVIAIGDRAFEYNQLTSVVIPDSVETIGERAFYANQLESIIIGNDEFKLLPFGGIVRAPEDVNIGNNAFGLEWAIH